MRIVKLISQCAVVAAVLAFAVSKAPAAEKLSDVLREAKWDGIIGTWVDADTNGENVKITYAWKFKDRLIEVTSKMGPYESVALMGVNGKTGDVYHMGADSQGGSSHGAWNVDDNGDAMLDVEYVSGDGQEGELSLRYQRVDNDAVNLTIEMQQPVEIKLVRAKTKQEKEE